MNTKLQIFAVMYISSFGASCLQPVKANDTDHAKEKFLKRRKSISAESITDCFLLDTESSVFKTYKAHAF